MSGRGARAAFAAAAVLVAVGVAAVSACRKGEPPAQPGAGGTATPGPVATGPMRDYDFTWSGDAKDLPWNRALWVVTTDGGKPQPPVALIFFPGEEIARVRARAGERWYVHSEQLPTRAIARILWTCRVDGAFGDESGFTVPIPPRAYLAITGKPDADPGDVTVAVADVGSGARLAAIRKQTFGLRFGVWDSAAEPGKEDWRPADLTAPPLPWTWNELRPGGKFVIAGHARGKQWTAIRAEMKAGETVTLDVDGQPPGGGTIECDEPRLELLLGGDLTIPPVRTTLDFLRARWENVPPGRHAVRYPDGTVVPVDVEDGGDVKLPRTPAGQR